MEPTNRTWTNVGPGVFISNDGVKIERDGELWMSTFVEEGVPPGFNETLECAMLDADALEYEVSNGMWVIK